MLHADHVDYLRDGHVHREHSTDAGVHYDERSTCACANCSCANCTCSTCNHAV